MMPPVYNAQVWIEGEYPYRRCAVFEIAPAKEPLRFVKVAFDNDGPPCIMSEPDGRWLWDPDELLADFAAHGYRPASGCCRIVPCEMEEPAP